MNIICVTPRSQVCGTCDLSTKKGERTPHLLNYTTRDSPQRWWWVQVSSKWSYKWTAHDRSFSRKLPEKLSVPRLPNPIRPDPLMISVNLIRLVWWLSLGSSNVGGIPWEVTLHRVIIYGACHLPFWPKGLGICPLPPSWFRRNIYRVILLVFDRIATRWFSVGSRWFIPRTHAAKVLLKLNNE